MSSGITSRIRSSLSSLAILIGLHTGMRKSELFRFRWEQLRWARKEIVIQSAKSRRFRVVAMTPVLEEVLRTERQRQEEAAETHGFVISYRGRPIRSNIAKSLKAVITRAGIAKSTLHGFRHTFGTHLAIAGVERRKIQTLMGHQDDKTTEKYDHVSPHHVKAETAKLPYAGKPKEEF